MRLSILNFFSSPHEAVELAELCDGLACVERFWVGEHHAEGQVPDPLALAFVLAGVTERVRVGTGATSLYLRNPYMVAETALMLSLFYPGRIDLGVSRIAGSGDPMVAAYLQEGLDPAVIAASYDERVRRVRDVLVRSKQRAVTPVQRVGVPPLFMMGTSTARARYAAELGLGFVASFHHGGTVTTIGEQIAAYRDAFVPCGLLPSSHAIAVISGFASDDRARLREVRERLERSLPAGTAPIVSYGSPANVAEAIHEAASAVAADEVMFLSNERDCADCYRALASAWTTVTPLAGAK